MNTTIHRYGLYVTDYQVLRVPSRYVVLSAKPGRAQRAGLHSVDTWIRVTPSDDEVDLAFYILGTGTPWPTYPKTNSGVVQTIDLSFIDTCVMDNDLVWHVFIGPVVE